VEYSLRGFQCFELREIIVTKNKPLGFSGVFLFPKGVKMTASKHFHNFPQQIEPAEWFSLSTAIQNESMILNTRTTPEDLATVYNAGLAVVLEQNGKIIGFVALWPVAKKYLELGSIWIRPDHRGYGLGKQLYKQTYSLPSLTDHLVFAVTQNKVSLRAGQAAGFMIHTDWSWPIPWALTCGPCDKWKSEKEKHLCPWRNHTCWLYLSPAGLN